MTLGSIESINMYGVDGKEMSTLGNGRPGTKASVHPAGEKGEEEEEQNVNYRHIR